MPHVSSRLSPYTIAALKGVVLSLSKRRVLRIASWRAKAPLQRSRSRPMRLTKDSPRKVIRESPAHPAAGSDRLPHHQRSHP